MDAFFENPVEQKRLDAAAWSWIGTPFVKGAAIKGAGVDCIHLAAELYRECGVFDSYQFPRYTLDGGRHLKTSLVLPWLQVSDRFALVDIADPRCGDVLCFKLAAVEHHVGVQLTGGQFIHCWMKRGVLIGQVLDPSYQRILTHVFRPLSAQKD